MAFRKISPHRFEIRRQSFYGSRSTIQVKRNFFWERIWKYWRPKYLVVLKFFINDNFWIMIHFLHKIWCIFFDPFFLTAENRQHTQNTSNFMPLTNKQRMLYFSGTVNIHSGQVCQHRKKKRKSNVHSPQNWKIHLIFWTDLVYMYIY